MLNPHREKYFSLYWDMVHAAAKQSVAERHQVGAIVVTPTGMISVGWNGQPAGLPNECEDTWIPEEQRRKTKPTVVHAERNAIKKMTRQGVPTDGSILLVSRAPCITCAVDLQGLGLKHIWFYENHDDMRGVDLLNACNTPTQLYEVK